MSSIFFSEKAITDREQLVHARYVRNGSNYREMLLDACNDGSLYRSEDGLPFVVETVLVGGRTWGWFEIEERSLMQVDIVVFKTEEDKKQYLKLRDKN